MTTTNAKNKSATPRVVGCLARLQTPCQIEAWSPPNRTQLAAMPPLPVRSGNNRGAALVSAPAPRPQRQTIRIEPLAQRAADQQGEAPQRARTEREPSRVERTAPPASTVLPEGVEEGSVQALVWKQPERAARLVRTTMLLEQEPEEEPEMPLMQKMAVLFVTLEERVSGALMKHLSDCEIEEIALAIGALGKTARATADAVLAEFGQQLQADEKILSGGVDFARQALEEAMGPRKAEEILERINTRATSGFYMLKNTAADQIAPFLSNEHPQTLALILSQLDPDQAAGILAQLPERMQADVAYRVATLGNITPNVLREIEESLEQSLRDIFGGNQDVGGPKVVADMINATAPGVEKNVLDQMEGHDPKIAASVRNLMFVFDDIVKLTDRELQLLLREVDQKDLVVAMKGAAEKLRERILNNMSEKVRNFITEEMEFIGPMRLSAVEEVQSRIVQQVWALAEQGQITLVRGPDDDSLV